DAEGDEILMIQGAGTGTSYGYVIDIPYCDEAGNQIFVRKRNPPDVQPRFYQPVGVKLQPYGMNRLDVARKVGRLYLCEGESNTWSLWYCGLPALGLPGAGATEALQQDHVEALGELILMPDNDTAGEQFVAGICDRLSELGYSGGIYRVQVPKDFKDVNEWFAAANGKEKFMEELGTAVAAAKLLNVEKRKPPRNPLISLTGYLQR